MKKEEYQRIRKKVDESQIKRKEEDQELHTLRHQDLRPVQPQESAGPDIFTLHNR